MLQKTMLHYKRLVLVMAFLALLLAVFHFSGLRGNVNHAFLHQKLADNAFTGLLIFIALFSIGNLIQIPGWIFLAAAVLALGKSWGGVATYIAAVVSCGFTFGVIKSLGGDALRQIKSPYAVRIFNSLDRRPVMGVFFLRLLMQTAPALNYALAMSGIKFRHYLMGTVVGLPIPIALYCLFFDYLATVMHIGGH
jgi:uncharacterized membrane protein YdjX (TVP38/TMEM64 family)